MSGTNTYIVSTKVLNDQARVTIDELTAEANQAYLPQLDAQGLQTAQFIQALKAAYRVSYEIEAVQERLKVEYTQEASQDRELAEQGYRWVLRLRAKVKSYMADYDPEVDSSKPLDLRQKFRFGKLRNARARSVVYELRILIPEAEAYHDKLEKFGMNRAFIQQGKEILRKLGYEQQETAEAKTKREETTRQVRKAERRLTQLLRQLNAADEAAALERVDAARRFRLDIIGAEVGRIRGDFEARLAARPADAPSPDAPGSGSDAPAGQ